MNKENIAAIYPLNSTQKGLLFHSIQNPNSDPGFLHVQFSLAGALDLATLKEAWQRVLARHEALRMSVQMPAGQQPMLVVSKSLDLDWLFSDLCNLDLEEQESRIENFLAADRHTGLDLADPPAMRLAIFQTKAQKYRVVWSCHHVFLDGWSSTLLLRELMEVYDSLKLNRMVNLPPAGQIRDYVGWTKRQSTEEAIDYWRLYLDDLEIAPSLSRLAAKTNNNQELRSAGSSDLTVELNQVANRLKVTPACLIYAGWAIMLSAITQKQDVIFGETTSGRHSDVRGWDAMAGCFAGSLPNRCKIAAHESLNELVQQIHHDSFASLPFRHLPLSEIQNCTDANGSNTLFESLVVVENLPWHDIEIESDGLSVHDYHAGITSTYPLTLVASPTKNADGWLVDFFHNEKLDNSKVALVARLFSQLMDQICQSKIPDIRSIQEWLEGELPVNKSEGPLCQVPTENLLLPAVQLARNPTELEIARIWEELLKTSAIDVNTDFLSLGGRSITAVRMISMIEERMGRRLSLIDLIENPTIAGIASKLQTSSGSNWRSLIPIQPKGSEPAIFCVHAGGGHALFLRALGEHFDGERPLFGLQPVGLDGECEPMSTYQEIANLFVNEMRAVQPSGPYHLAGHCHGARVCLEIAAILKSQNEIVASFIVLDTFAPGRVGDKNFSKPPKRGLMVQLQNLMTGRFVKACKALVRRTKKLIRETCVPKFGSTFAKKLYYMDKVQEACTKANSVYDPAVFEGKVHLIRADDTVDWKLDWGPVSNEWEEYILPIRHQKMFQEPDVEILANKIREIVDQSS